MIRNIKLTIEYDGTDFKGWQIQKKGERTVQGEIQKALQKIFQSRIKLIGSGRTDTGVHALGQMANFKTSATMSCEKIERALNANLPKDIVILKAEEVDVQFHSQYSAKQKTYCYTILNRAKRPAYQRQYFLHYPQTLNLVRMRKEAKALIGRHDFKSFAVTDPSKKDQNTVRSIKRLDIKKKGDLILIEIEADGFLYKMVRNIVGTLFNIGTGRLPTGSIPQMLKAKDRKLASPPVPTKGLSLLKVNYENKQ